MATSTTNYNLRKPDTNDNVTVLTDIADNMDDIDTELKRVDNAATGGPVARLMQGAAQTISTSTWTSVTFDSEDIDTHNGHDNSTNPSRWVCPTGKGGYYWLGGAVWLAANATGVRFNRWAKNGSPIDNGGVEVPVTPAGAPIGIAAKGILVSLNPTDYVELQVWQNSGGNLDTFTGGTDEDGSDMSIAFIRPL